MALYRCGSSGGTLSETTLWTNPSPTSSFAQQHVTLSQSIGNFDFVRFYMRYTTSDSTEISYIATVADVRKWLTSNNTGRGAFLYRGTANYARNIMYSNDTDIMFDDSVGTKNATGTNNSYSIPTKITGVNL